MRLLRLPQNQINDFCRKSGREIHPTNLKQLLAPELRAPESTRMGVKYGEGPPVAHRRQISGSSRSVMMTMSRCLFQTEDVEGFIGRVALNP